MNLGMKNNGYDLPPPLRQYPRQVGEEVPTLLRRQLYTLQNPAGGGGGTGGITHPFQLIDASDGSGANLRVRYGTVNDVVPTFDAASLSTNPEHALASAGTYLVYLAVAYDNDGVVSGVTVEADLSGTLPAYTDNANYITLGEADVEEVDTVLVVSELRQAVTHSLRHGLCGRVVEAGSITTAGTPYFWGL